MMVDMTPFEELLQRLKEQGVLVTIRRSSAQGGSHSPSTAARGSGKQTKKPEHVAEWEHVGVPGKSGQTGVTREEALQLIREGAADEAGLTG